MAKRTSPRDYQRLENLDICFHRATYRPELAACFGFGQVLIPSS
jgi:hypothetical protein